MLKEHLILIILSVFSIEDMKKRRIHLLLVVMAAALGVLYQIFWGALTFTEILGGIFVGVILLALGRLTGEAIGYGDGLVFLVTGVFLGGLENLSLLFTSLTIAFIFSSIQIIIRKKTAKDEIPFIPFIWIANLLRLGGIYYEKIF